MKSELSIKNWETPSVEEVDLSETEYGGTTVTNFDNVYQNADGKWEGTFVPDEDTNS